MSLEISDIDINNNLQVLFYIFQEDIVNHDDFCLLSTNPNISIKIVKKLRDKNWNWKWLTQNISITEKDIEDNLDYPWDISYLSGNIFPQGEDEIEYLISEIHSFNLKKTVSKNISVNLLEKLRTKLVNDNFRFISSNPNLTVDYVRNNLNKIRNFTELCLNPCVDLNFIKSIPEIDWSIYGISANPNITIDIIQANPEIKWNTSKILQNPNLNWRNIYNIWMNNIKLDLYNLFYNLFDYHPHIKNKREIINEKKKIFNLILISDYRLCLDLIYLLNKY
jgi:hypothetical protein